MQAKCGRLVATLLLAGAGMAAGSQGAWAQDAPKCIRAVEGTVQPGVWDKVNSWLGSYLGTLTLQDRTAQQLSDLTELRVEIVQLAVRKKKLIEIFEADIANKETAATVTKDLDADRLLDVLMQIKNINARLASFSSGQFVITDAFKDLTVTFDEKEAYAACFYRASKAGDLAAMSKFAEKLRAEIEAVDKADKALTAYLQAANKT